MKNDLSKISMIFWILLGSHMSLFGQNNALPNIIIIQFDDLAYGDLGYLGSTDVSTPYIDQIASQSLIYENAYSTSPVCSPSRASLMTGLLPNDIRILGVLRSHYNSLEIIHKTKNIAQFLKELNYRTAHVEKWYLGIPKNCRPEALGFDYSFGILCGMADYYSHLGKGGMDRQHCLYENGVEVYKDGYLTELLPASAHQFIQGITSQPLLLIVNYTATHRPLQPNPSYNSNQSGTDRSIYLSMVQTVDTGVGKLQYQLKRLGLRGNSIVIITNDHGCPVRSSQDRNVAKNIDLTSGKYFLRDDGTRIPLVVKIPGFQHRVISHNVTNADIFPSILSLL